jgi:hypothetical protein
VDLSYSIQVVITIRKVALTIIIPVLGIPLSLGMETKFLVQSFIHFIHVKVLPTFDTSSLHLNDQRVETAQRKLYLLIYIFCQRQVRPENLQGSASTKPS